MKIIKLLFASLYVAIPLMGIYAIAIAVATFIENDFGSNAARVLIYNTWFFNVLHLWLLVCLIGVMIRYKFLAQKKYASFILHLSFVIIIVGAGITRFFGVEGLMNIREGQSNSAFVSSEIFLNVLLSNDESKYAIHIPVSVSYASNKMLNEKIAFGDSHFRIKSTAITKLTSDKKDTTAQMDAVISYKDKDYPLTLIGGGQMSEDSVVSFDDGTNAILSWGARDIDLGFSIKLEDFILERYAGSNSPSSYKSKVVVIDGEKEMPYDIFMNNVLDYKGYRFFQSSYDMDELGTILSVNNDPGKIPTYIGYFLLFVACVWLLFAKNSRFQKLNRFLKNQQIYSVIFALVLGFSIFGVQNLNAESPKMPESKQDSTLESKAAESAESTAIQSQNILDYISTMRDKSKAHAQKFGTLQVQSGDGKIKPLDTLASDLVHKMTKKNNFLGFSNTQIALGMLLYPNDWKNIKMIRVSTPQLRELLGLPKGEKYASFMDLFIANSASGESNATGEYKLKNYIEEANRKSPANRSKFDNDIIDVDERANIAYGIYSSQFFRFLPIPQNGEIWISPIEMLSFAGDELAGKIQAMLSNYFNAFEVGLRSGDFEKADEALQIIKDYQKEFGSAVMISDSKLKAEIFLNNANLFAKLILPYILVGIAMFILVFAYIFKPKDSLKRALKCFYFISCAIVLVHLFALILRWYIAGHAPWSNAYESMLYIAFTAGIAGVVFFRKSYLALSSANFLAGIALFVANLGFMNPQITNLMPVLKSYWLNIHVSVITASYGFLGLCFLLGVITLMLMICRKKGVDSANLTQDSTNATNPANLKIDSTINSITAINEMSMIFGLFLLTAGNFLGGIWANESWGRYWGWDPKETWALVSIGVYAIILHLRFIFKRNLQYIFAAASVVGFFSVLMTYFGVNYYLSGLHSYAAGDPLPIPKFLYFMVAFLVILIIIAFLKRKMEAVKI